MNIEDYEKVRKLLACPGIERIDRLYQMQMKNVVAKVTEAYSDKLTDEQAYDLGFHLTDWNYDAAFLMALLLYPEEFSLEEIAEGITGFLVHAPNHIAAATKLADYPIQDIFELGVLDGVDEEVE